MDTLPKAPNLKPAPLKIPHRKEWEEFTERRHDEMDFDNTSPDIITMNMDKFIEMSTVHASVNSQIRYKRDNYRDRWEVPAGLPESLLKEVGTTTTNEPPVIIPEGDCEDYALTKLIRLYRMGWALGALRPLLLWLPTKEFHAVLSIETDHGTWVLDNTQRYPKPISYLIGYSLRSRWVPGKDMWERWPYKYIGYW